MAKQKKPAEQKSSGMNGLERLRLRLRVSAMIQSPKAQAEQQVNIWRLETDSDQAWAQVLEDLAETDGLEMEVNEDGTMTLRWESMAEDDDSQKDSAPDMVIEHLHEEAPF